MQKRKFENFLSHGAKKKKTVPAEFIKHVLDLGFNEEDAPRLYEDKDNWTGVSTGGKILCVSQGCKFHTNASSDELFEHCRLKHQWKDYPCKEENCKFIAYSSMALKRHAQFHSMPPTTQHQFNCSKQKCKWTFVNMWKLQRHENTHDNILLKCVYCPYTCVEDSSLTMHQRIHFNIRDYKCDYCDRAFKQQGELNKHFNSQHSGVKTKCFKCDYESSVHNVHMHMNRTHGLLGYSWDAHNEKFVKM